VCTLAQYQDWEQNDDIYPAMQACSAPCTRVSFRVSQVKYRSRGDSVAFDCGPGYSSVIQLVFDHQATWEKEDYVRPLVTLLSILGGTLGLWLGLSLLSAGQLGLAALARLGWPGGDQ